MTRWLLLSYDLQALTVFQLGDPVGEVVFVVAVGDLLVFGASGPDAGGERLGDLREVVLESGGADDLQEPGGCVGGVPLGVGCAAGLVALFRKRHVVADAHPDHSFQ